MNEYVKFTIGEVEYYLLKRKDGTWYFAQAVEDVDIPTVTVMVEGSGEDQTVVVETNDDELARTISTFYSTKLSPCGERMLGYYPLVIQRLLEFQALCHAYGLVFDIFHSDMELAMNDAYLSTMGEERITQWEVALNIVPNATDSIDDRRDSVIARFRGGNKLNTQAINDIVNAFTGGTANAWFKNSTLFVEITPPPDNKQFVFSNVERELKRRVPAHLGIEVSRNYFTWADIKNDFASWQEVSDNIADWESVHLYVPFS